MKEIGPLPWVSFFFRWLGVGAIGMASWYEVGQGWGARVFFHHPYHHLLARRGIGDDSYWSGIKYFNGDVYRC